jgi:hypothetical protein
MKKIFLVSVGIAAFLANTTFLAKATIAPTLYNESWENNLDGWTVAGGNMTLAGFSSTLGVTEGSYSVGLGAPLGAPNYGIQFSSSASTALTLSLASASQITMDAYVPAGDFGSLLKFDLIVSQKTGMVSVSLDNSTFSQSADIGGEKILTWTIPASVQTTLAANPTKQTSLIFEIGGNSTSPNDVVYLDNLQVVGVPEPSTMALAGLGMAGWLVIRRRKT